MFATKFTVFALVGLLCKVAVPSAAQTTGSAQLKPPKVLNVVPMRYVDPTSGANMYRSYCAACHGGSGKGDGPAVDFLKTMPTDLTTLARNNHGEFPTSKVRGTLLFGTRSRAHGTMDMPIWGPFFKSRQANVAQLRVNNLVEYLRTLQEK